MDVEIIRQQFMATGIIEWMAFGLGVAQVVLAWRKKAENFYAGLFSVLFYTYVFYQYQLYAESVLNAYYVIISLLGLLAWSKTKNKAFKIQFCTQKEWGYYGLIALFVFGLQAILLSRFTPSTVPIPDALVSALAWVGSYLLVKQKIENWLWLTASNGLAIPLQLYKGMPLTASLTLIYLIVGIIGFIDWKKTAKRHAINASQ